MGARAGGGGRARGGPPACSPPAARERLSGTSLYHLPLGTRTGKFPFSVWGVRHKGGRALARISRLRSFYETRGGRGWEGRL